MGATETFIKGQERSLVIRRGRLAKTAHELELAQDMKRRADERIVQATEKHGELVTEVDNKLAMLGRLTGETVEEITERLDAQALVDAEAQENAEQSDAEADESGDLPADQSPDGEPAKRGRKAKTAEPVAE